MNWNLGTGEYTSPILKDSCHYTKLFDQAWDYSEQRVSGLAESWLSRPGGEYFLGISFHYPQLFGANGTGTYLEKFHYSPSPFLLSINQDDHSSWHVNACLCGSRSKRGLQGGWEWQPGVLIIDCSTRYTLPSIELSAISGSEIAEDDDRLYYGFYDYRRYHQHIAEFLSVINDLIAPGWPEWPFGRKQLSNATVVWTRVQNALPDLLLLAQHKQHGQKCAYLGSSLTPIHSSLKPESSSTLLKLSKPVKLLYQSVLLLDDGYLESAVLTSVLSLKLAASEILRCYDISHRVERRHESSECSLLNLFSELLPLHRVTIPKHLLETLELVSDLESNLYTNTQTKPDFNRKVIDSIGDVLIWLRQSFATNQ